MAAIAEASATDTWVARITRWRLASDLWSSLGLMSQVCLVAVLGTLGLRPLDDPDLGWHLRTGELVLQQGFTSADPWSFASSRPWILHEWGGEVIMYGAYKIAGYHGVIAYRVLLAALLGWLVVRSCRRHAGPVITVVVSLLAFLTLWPWMTERPQLISLCLLAASLPALRTWIQADRTPWWLPPLICVWVNLHAAWALALILYAALVLGHVIEVGVNNWRRYAPLLLVGGLSGLASLLNPDGLRLLSIFKGGGSSFIVEFAAPRLFSIYNVSTAILVLIIIVRWARSGEAVRATDVTFVVSAVGLGMMYNRNIPVAAIALAPIAAQAWVDGMRRPSTEVLPAHSPRDRYTAIGLATVFVLAAAVKLAGVQGLTPHMPRTSPEKLDALPGHARVLNEYGFGGWLIWTARDVSPGIDGRSEIYTPSYVSGYFAALGLHPGWEQFVAKNRFDAAWIHESTPLTEGLLSLGWHPVWHEGDTVVLVPPAISG